MAKGPWAPRRRPLLRRLRRDDSGQALVLVMFISTITVLMLTMATTALTNQVRPAAASVDSGRATAAAQAGVENFLSWVNTNCPPNGGFLCASLHSGVSNAPAVTDPTNQQGTVITGGDGAGTAESYYWNVVYAASGFARVKSVGQVLSGKANPKYRTVTLVADIDAVPSFNNFQYYTKYETYSPDFLESFYRKRSIQITPGYDLTGTSIGSGTTSTGGALSWNGVCDTTTTPGCDPNHSTDICNDLYYPNPNGPGRGTDSAWNNSVRRPSATVQAQLGTDKSFAYYSEGGQYTPTSGPLPPPVTHDDVCDSTMEPNMVMNGPIYSQDAYLIDRGQPTGSAPPSMPNIGGPAYSLWNGAINSAQLGVGYNGGYDRAYTGTNGAAYLTASYPSGQVFPIYESQELDLPANASDSLAEAACVYTGPTRIQLVSGIANITSPLTPAGNSACYRSTGSFSNVPTSYTDPSTGNSFAATDPTGGVINAQVPINSTIIYVRNAPSSIARVPATASSPIFDGVTNLTPPPDTQTDGLAGTWTDEATYSSTAGCPAPANVLKRRNLDCETGTGTPAPDVFTNIKAAVDTELAKPSTTAANLTTVITNQLSVASRAPITGLGSVSYSVTVTASTPSITPSQRPATATDGFLQPTAGSGYTTTVSTWNAKITRTTCTSMKNGNCVNSATDIVSGSLSTSRSSAVSQSKELFPWFGSSTSTTDPSNDVTQYNHADGDAYVEGQIQGEASIIAEHDVVITNDITYKNPTLATTTDGLALVANHNVRVYRPMTCTNAGDPTKTQPGYCPDDTEGVYTAQLAFPDKTYTYPEDAYTPTAAPSLTTSVSANGKVSLRTGNVYATIFALRGSFDADNFYRGGMPTTGSGTPQYSAAGTGINIYGGMYQYHRGATSLPYQNRPYQGSTTKMPGMVVTYNYDNMRAGNTTNGGLRIPYIPTPQGRQTANTWNIVGISTGS